MKKIGIIICSRYQNCGGCPGGNIEYVPEEMNITEIAADLFHDDEPIMKDYD